MRRTVLVMLALALAPFCAFAVDGVVLVNQSTLTAAGGTYAITQAGSYKLSGNLQAKDPNTDVIVIATDNVTIDLNGFSILGTTVCSIGSCKNTGTGRGIATSSAVVNRPDFFNITIRNGVIQGMGFRGIFLSGDSFLIEYIHVDSSGESGIVATRQNAQQLSAIIQHNNLTLNGRDGVSLFGGGAVTDNVSSNNAFSGIALLGAFVGFPSIGTVARNVLTNNGTFGFFLAGGSVNLIGNIFAGNAAGPNAGGVNQGQNLCGNASCPGAML
jgi:hypothetical protein